MPADGGIRFGNYVLLRRLARGGMAEVFLAQQRGLEGFDRRVAVKRILPHLADGPDFVKMFLGEAKLAAQLTHPNVVHIYEFGKVDHDYFIAMEYVEGVHAGQLFKQSERDRMPPTLIARIGADAAAALNYAHELHGPNRKPLGIVHRDVSPANLMISFDGVVKLCDFGIAKAAALTDQRTNPGQVKGKYAYMSPEQTVASSLDGRSDVFSLAVVLWELLAGKTIVPRGDPVAAMRTIRDGKLQPIAQAAPGTPAPLAAAITWALATRREDRATAAQLTTALEAFLKGAPELATPMQLGAWIRARFPREPQAAPERPTASDLSAGAGTAAAPGTVGGMPDGGTGTRIAPATRQSLRGVTEDPSGRPRQLVGVGARAGTGQPTPAPAPVAAPVPVPAAAAARNVRADEPDDYSETIALVGDADAGGETRLVDDKARPAAKRVTRLATPAAGPGDATMLADPSHRPSHQPSPRPSQQPPLRPSSGGAAPDRGRSEPAPRDRSSGAVHEGPRAAADQATVLASPRSPADQATVLASPHGFPPPPGLPMASGLPPHLLPSPTMLASPPFAPQYAGPGTAGMPSGPLVTGTESVARIRPPRRLVLFLGLAGIAVASFLIALLVRSPRREAAAPAPPRAAPADAAAPEATPDAAPDATPASATSPDPPLRLQLYKVDTRPTGGMVQIGDQRRVAPADFMLPPGKHTVVAELDGWQPERREIEIADGVDFRHEIPFTRRAATTAAATTPRAAQTGTLTVRTTPYSDVYLGDRKLGQAPFADKEVPAGTYWLTFKNPRHPTVKKQVTVLPGKLLKLPPFELPPP